MGLTLLDLGGPEAPIRLSTMSHVTARLEIRSLIATLNLPKRLEENVEVKTSESKADQAAA